ncbi:TolC family protein [Hydrotalea sp.]|uniref:TolC family protein n=1 Tax=Hydrotalea sp. TaxID=2881279 RepID=UPI003D0B4220
MKQKLMILLFVTISSSIVLRAQTGEGIHAFSLQQCIEYAHKNNAQIKNALLNVQIQQQINRGVTSAALPQLNGGISTNYYPNVAVQSFPNFIAAATYGVLVQEGVKNGAGNPIVAPSDFGYVQAQFGTPYNATASVALSQILFDGQVFVGLQARATSMQYQQKNVEVTEENIKANIYKVYYQLVVSKTQVALLDANIERFQKLLHDTQEMYKNGFAEKLDVDKTSVQLANLQTEKQKTLNSIAVGYLGLKILLGMPVKDSLILTDNINEDAIKDNVLNDTAYQYINRKDFQYLQLVKKLNQYNVKRYQMSYLPTVTLSGSFAKQAFRSQFNFFDKKGDWFTASAIGLNISVPLFDGFAKDSKIKQSRLELKQTDNSLDALKLSIDNDVKTAQLNFASALETLDFQKKNMQLAETVYNQTKKKYEVGTGSNTEITSAETDLKTAQTNYVNALYDAVIARVDYLKATGKL